jgi:CheY-like chemotaxis protein
MERKNVLLIDDDELSRELVEAMLERLQAAVVAEASGGAGLQRLEREAFDLVLVDLKLPDMHGTELLQRLAERREPAPPVVVVSGAEVVESRERCRQLGCAGYLAKPFSFQQFEAVVGPLLG